ncbi:Holliday junction DNA helicase RuvA [Microbacterium testaceum]|uniref:Holliday junction branch migration protein RuvA n=1 Tax=Microbacterium TaxID=33882 RepID=UPI002787B0AA|nr:MULTISPECIES: Holliday junction branch migration protein RuvA [Microbacterium]MDQ1113700.1 Holliday junction DNA helicase RuvA [Microbacterium testaceum]MDR6099199.1 Holliday junction DNA helicase RuvA [Microbacterium sp. SORGH_AS_0454]
MISSLHGTAAHVADDSLVIVVGGVGFSVAVTAQLARTVHVGDDVHLHTNLIVREDALSLYGFEAREELTVFTQLISVTGVGPKSALGVLSSLTVPQIAQAVADDYDAPFRRVSGIGPKTAKLIVVQLAGKLQVAPSAAPAAASPHGQIPAQVTQALVGLGWTERTAAEAVASVAESASEADRASVQSLLRLTLALLGPARKESVSG